jgi:hypothetical protein
MPHKAKSDTARRYLETSCSDQSGAHSREVILMSTVVKVRTRYVRVDACGCMTREV